MNDLEAFSRTSGQYMYRTRDEAICLPKEPLKGDGNPTEKAANTPKPSWIFSSCSCISQFSGKRELPLEREQQPTEQKICSSAHYFT
jgi:hypothetical protein